MYDLDKVPFSRFGSYFSFLINDWGPLGNGLYLRVHSERSPQVFKIDPMRDGEVLTFETQTSPSILRLKPAGGGLIEFVISDLGTVRVRGEGVSLRLDMPAERWTWAYQVPGAWAFNYSPHQVQLALQMLRGDVDVVAPWQKGKGFCWETTHAVVAVRPDASGRFEAAIDEFLTTWVAPARPPFDECQRQVEKEYADWTVGLPEVDAEYVATRDLAAYVNWSAVVDPAGCVTRPTMYMSKAGMCNVYNWDNVFNAMAHCRHRPQLAFDQLLVMADHQDEFGKSPTSLNRSSMRTTITNSPVHGWGLRYMWDTNPSMMTPPRMAEAYEYLSRWTDWICNHRTWPGDRLPHHQHGFDGGWDNSSIFDQGVPVITPDYAAYTILQMEVLGDLAEAMGRRDAAEQWRARSGNMLNALVEDLWHEDRFVGIIRPSGKKVVCDSLLICMPMVLGRRLPKMIQDRLVARIKSHLTPHGLATEKLDSPNFVQGGYWRGPIWAPSTMLVTSGLLEIGQTELAHSIMRSFCQLCVDHGFYENFDPVTGKGYYDSAYTWTSSVFMLFANYFNQRSH